MKKAEKELEQALMSKNTSLINNVCSQNNFNCLLSILNQNKGNDKTIKIKLLCNWCSSSELTCLWNKMSKGNYTWNNIVLITDDSQPDYWVIINGVFDDRIKFDKKRTILFRMEPNMASNPHFWKEWSNPSDFDFLRIYRHEEIIVENKNKKEIDSFETFLHENKNKVIIEGQYNNCEWHLSLTYNQLSNYSFEKTENNILSTILSDKYSDIGHIKRVDFVKFLETKSDLDQTSPLCIHVYGGNKWNYTNYKGSLPSHCKDKGLLPYKYTFNCENHFIDNYFTEKLIDGILAECLVFYAGCPNISQYIDSRAYIQLELSNFEKDYAIIKHVINNDLYKERLPFIKQAKKKILNELQFFPRLEKFLNQIQQNKLK